jgi:dienelactone hydrolase
MKRISSFLAALAVSGVAAAASPVPPAPVLSTQKDADGRPLPFGRQPVEPYDKALGSGPYKAVMATDPSLPAHVLYYPKDLKRAGKLPIVAWGNGACINAGNRFRYFLTEIASHGFLVAANGVMANDKLEVGPQENPAVRAPGTPPPPPPTPEQRAANQRRAPGTTTKEQLIESIDWAIRENERAGSPFYHRLDTSKIAVMGQSCGGVQALGVAGDPRITTLMIWSSGVGMIPNNPANPEQVLASIHSPIAYIYGDAQNDIAYRGASQNVPALAARGIPVFGAWQDKMTHLGTYGQKNGGFFARIATAWLDWQLKDKQSAAAMFRGANCTLCTAPSWHVTKSGID